MKSRYTIIIRDNNKKQNVIELDANSVNYSLNTRNNVLHHDYNGIAEYLGSKTKLTVEANVILAAPEEKEPNIYELDEEVTQKISDCRYGHSLITSMGFFKETTYCKTCGLEIKTDEV